MLETEKKDAFKNNSFVKVDIILPTYQPDIFLLKRAIDSILKQEYLNWILYLVQDGNDIDLSSIIKSYNDQRIKYFKIPHTGKASALNFALQKGHSKYIAYLDDDDIWYPNHLMDSISYMKDNDAKFVHTDAYEIFLSETKEKEYIETSRRKLHLGLITELTLMAISHINVVHERDLLNLAGLYNDSLQFFIDWDMFQRMAKYTKPYHITIFTCEHYIYSIDGINKNTISSIHNNNLQLHEEKVKEMYKKSFELLTVDSYIEVLKELNQKDYQIKILENKLNQITTKSSYFIRIFRSIKQCLK